MATVEYCALVEQGADEVLTVLKQLATFDLREPDPQQQAAAIHVLIAGGYQSLQSCLAGFEPG